VKIKRNKSKKSEKLQLNEFKEFQNKYKIKRNNLMSHNLIINSQ
jgi:hypothetical protein